MKKYRTRSLRKFLEVDGMEEKVFYLVARMLGYWKTPPDRLWEAFQALKHMCPVKTGEELIAFPSFTVRDGAYYPGAAVYSTQGLRDLLLDIPEYDKFAYEWGTGLLRDEAWGHLVGMSTGEREALLEKSCVMPDPVRWETVRDPMGILVNGPRVAAYIVAWALADRWKRPFAYLPAMIGPLLPGDSRPEAVYEAVSRYLMLSVGSIRYSIDWALDVLEFPSDDGSENDYDDENDENNEEEEEEE